MARWTVRISLCSLSLVLLGGTPLLADDTARKPLKEMPSFGVLRTPAVDGVRSQAQGWLKDAGKTDATTQKVFDVLWTSDRPLLDKVVGTFALGDPAVAQLMKDARDPETAAPTSVPNLIKDQKLPVFFLRQPGLGLCQSAD